MDPAQSLCGHELLWSQRPSDENFRVCDFLCYAVVVFKLKKVKIRKSGLQLIAQPWRRMPEFETMMVDDEDFHFCRFAPNRQAASLMVNATRACCSGLGATPASPLFLTFRAQARDPYHLTFCRFAPNRFEGLTRGDLAEAPVAAGSARVASPFSRCSHPLSSRAQPEPMRRRSREIPRMPIVTMQPQGVSTRQVFVTGTR
jgi:hypothetical protein